MQPTAQTQPTSLADQVLPFVQAANQSASAADWATVKKTTEQGLECLHPVASSPGLAVKLLLLQAQAAHQLQEHEGSLQALDLAVQLQPTSSEALWMRAQVHAAAGHQVARFMDLRSISQHQPTYPGLVEALQQAAQAVSQQQASSTRAKPPPRTTYIHTTRRAASNKPSAAAAPHNHTLQAAYRTLGLQSDASLQDVRRSYKQLASTLHPDKWVRSGQEQQAHAEERFKQVSAAYQAIMEQH